MHGGAITTSKRMAVATKGTTIGDVTAATSHSTTSRVLAAQPKRKLSRKLLLTAIIVVGYFVAVIVRPAPSIVRNENHPKQQSNKDESSGDPSTDVVQEQPTLPQHSSHCPKFPSPLPALNWDEIHALEWNGTPAILWQDDNHFPTTRFSGHVTSLVELVDMEQMEDYCFWKFTLTVDTPGTRPSDLFCQGKVLQRMVPWWCVVLERLFFHSGNITTTPQPQSANLRVLYNSSNTSFAPLNPILPGSVSFAVSSDDYYQPPNKKAKGRPSKNKASSPYTCFANSAPNNGTFAITNFLELQRMADRTTYAILPWEQRCTIPIWRGSAWIIGSKHQDAQGFVYQLNDTDHSFPILHQARQDCPRCRAVEFSWRYPTLLDAKFGDAKNGFFHPLNTHYQEWWKDNATNGLDRLLPIHPIPSAEYYSHYQVAVVLCGLGAAFRTPIHFSTATAVLLQACPYQEWYHALTEFQAWKHYIPLQADLTDLYERLTWVQRHPDRVRAIAAAGREFYQDYLSFQRNYEHFYELIYRLALKKKKLEEKG